MSEQPPYQNPNGDTGVNSDSESGAGAPRWVKVFGIIAIVLVLLFVLLHLIGGGLGGHTH